MRLATDTEIFFAFAIENPLLAWQRDPDAFWELVRVDYPDLDRATFDAAMKLKADHAKNEM